MWTNRRWSPRSFTNRARDSLLDADFAGSIASDCLRGCAWVARLVDSLRKTRMRTWFGSVLFVVLATFAVASGCGSKPEVINPGPDLDAGPGGNGNGGNGSGATGGGFVPIGDGGEAGT